MESLEAKKWLPEEGYEVTDWFPSALVNQENLIYWFIAITMYINQSIDQLGALKGQQDDCTIM